MTDRYSFYPCHLCHGEPLQPPCEVCDGLRFTVSEPLGEYTERSQSDQGQLEKITSLLGAVISYAISLEERIDNIPNMDRERQKLKEDHKSSQGYWDSLHQSNSHLRDEVKGLRRLVTDRVVLDEYEAKPKSLLQIRDTSQVARGIRIMVNAELKHALGNETFGPDQLRTHIHDVLTGQLKTAIKKQVGIDSWGEIERGPLRERIQELIKPAIEKAVEEIVPESLASLDLPTTVEKWQKKEMRDLFARELRSALLDGVRTRAVTVATDAVTEHVDDVIREEFPFLDRYLAMDRLGKANGG